MSSPHVPHISCSDSGTVGSASLMPSSFVLLITHRYTFVEGVANPRSVTILIKGPSDYVIAQIKEAVRDGLRAVKNVLDDKAVVPGR